MDDLMNRPYNGWENRLTWLVHLHLSSEQALMQEVTALVTSQTRLRVASRLLKTWVAASLFHWLCGPAQELYRFSVNMRFLAWDMVGTALAYTDWRSLVGLLVGQVKKSKNVFTMTLYRCILSDTQLTASVQEILQAFPDSYQCSEILEGWFREQVDTFFDSRDEASHLPGIAALLNELLQQTYKLVVWEHVARAFRPGY